MMHQTLNLQQVYQEPDCLHRSLHDLVRHLHDRTPHHDPDALLKLERQHVLELQLRLHL